MTQSPQLLCDRRGAQSSIANASSYRPTGAPSLPNKAEPGGESKEAARAESSSTTSSSSCESLGAAPRSACCRARPSQDGHVTSPGWQGAGALQATPPTPSGSRSHPVPGQGGGSGDNPSPRGTPPAHIPNHFVTGQTPSSPGVFHLLVPSPCSPSRSAQFLLLFFPSAPHASAANYEPYSQRAGRALGSHVALSPARPRLRRSQMGRLHFKREGTQL